MKPTQSRPTPRCMVFIPAYKAAATIEDTLSLISERTWQTVEEVFVHDNHSDDDTFEKATGFAQKNGHENLKVYRMERNLGYGGSEKRAITYAIERGVDFLAVLHADGQYSPDHLDELFATLARDGVAMVQGSRVGHLAGGMPKYKVVANLALNKLEEFAFGYGLREYHRGLRAYSCKALAAMPYLECGDGHEITVDMVAMLRALRMQIGEIEVPTFYSPQVSQTSPWTSIKYGLGVIACVGQYFLARSRLYVGPNFRSPELDSGRYSEAQARSSGRDDASGFDC